MELNLAAAAVAPADRKTLLGRWSWALFDGARIPDNVLVNIFVFSSYFRTVVISDPVHGQVVWSYTSAVGAILVAIGAPILGAIADAGGRRKPWLVGCIAVGVPSMMALWYATPGMNVGLVWILVAIVGSMLFYEYSAVFCNAIGGGLLQQRVDRLEVFQLGGAGSLLEQQHVQHELMASLRIGTLRGGQGLDRQQYVGHGLGAHREAGASCVQRFLA